MTIELTILISGISMAFAVYFGIANVRRNRSIDERKSAVDMTTVIVRLEGIAESLTEIKYEMGAMKNDLKETLERLIRAEESVKQAHKRIDSIEERLQKYIVPVRKERDER